MADDRLQAFIASAGALAGTEARKAKLLYVRNELAEYANENANSRAFGALQLFFLVFPPLWVVLFVQRRMMISEAALQSRRIQNALDVWREDLGGDAAELAAELERCDASAPQMLPAGLTRRLPSALVRRLPSVRPVALQKRE